MPRGVLSARINRKQERSDARLRRRGPAEEEAGARDRPGPDLALRARTGRAGGPAAGGDRAAGGRQGQEAGTALGGGPVLQAMTGACSGEVGTTANARASLS